MAATVVGLGDAAARFPAETCPADGHTPTETPAPIGPGREAGRFSGYRRSLPAEQGYGLFGLDTERIVPKVNAVSGTAEWYLRTREGWVGPCETRASADQMLMRLKARWQKPGRGPDKPLPRGFSGRGWE